MGSLEREISRGLAIALHYPMNGRWDYNDADEIQETGHNRGHVQHAKGRAEV